MIIYTSYYNNRYLPRDGRRISISNSSPKWFDLDDTFRELSPEWEDVRDLKDNKISERVFVAHYKSKLYSLDTSSVLNKLKEGDILLCWEKATDFCHRFILSSFLRNLGIDIKELPYSK